MEQENLLLINILAGITNKSSGKAIINGYDIEKNVNSAKIIHRGGSARISYGPLFYTKRNS